MTQHQPDRLLINKNGDITTGLFEDTVARINGRDYDYRTPLGKPASRRARHFHYKQFQYFGVVSDELLIGCAFADTAYLGMAFFYVFDTRTGELREHTWRSPLGRALTLSDSPVDGESRFRQGKVDIAMGYHQAPGGTRRKSLTVTMPGKKRSREKHQKK